jgi:hypothetical protein
LIWPLSANSDHAVARAFFPASFIWLPKGCWAINKAYNATLLCVGLFVLRRNIHFGPPEPPFAERFFCRPKRACFALAVLALTISTLDLMNISLVKEAGAFLHELQQRSMLLQVAASSPTNTMAQELPAATHQATPIQLGSSINSNSSMKGRIKHSNKKPRFGSRQSRAPNYRRM